MAVKFLTSLDVAGDGAAAATAVGITLNNTQLQKFKVENRANDAAYTPASGAGQMYWNTTNEDMRYWDGTNWVVFGSAGAGINNIDATTNGTSLTTSNTLTGNGTLTLQWQGNGTTQYVDGAGNLKNISSLPQGDVTGITPTDGLTGDDLNGPVPIIKVEYAGTDNIVLKASDLNGVGTPATADSIMFSDATDNDVRTATISQILALAPQGDITGLTEGTYIGIDNPSGPVPTINHDLTSRTDTANTASPAFGASFTAVDSVTTNSTGHLTALNVKTVTLPSNPNTTYTLPVSAGGANSSVITLDASSGTDTTVTFNGTTNEIALTESTGLNGSITIGLPDDVTIADDLTVDGIITQSQTGEINTFASEVAVPTSTSSGNAVNLGQVQSLIAGVGIFQGGYNATTGLTTDLSSNGSLDGASNIELDKGDYFVVTVAGGAFYSETLEVGDMIYANQDITANSTPAQTVYTVVIQDENIAGSGSTDGGTQKGVAGFDSDTFTVSASGWVQSKVFNGLQPGVVPNTSGNSASVFLNGQGAFTTPPNYYVTTASFDDTTGVLTISGNNAVVGDTVDLDGRYLTDNQTITLSGDVSGSGTTSITTTITADAVEASMLNDNVISGQTELNATPEGGDEILISDGGTIKRVSYTNFIDGADSGVTTVSPDTANSKLGIAVADGSTANPKVGLDINGLASAVPVGSDTIPFYDAGTNKKTTVSNLTAAVQTATSKAYTIASGETTADLTYPFTLTAATINDVMVQAVISSGTNTGETVFCDVDRISTTVCRITFGSALTTSVRVLVQKIG